MPHSQSPRRPTSSDLSGGFGIVEHDKSSFCASLPLHAQSQSLPTSIRLSSEPLSMATAVHRIASFSRPEISSTTTSVENIEPTSWPSSNVTVYQQFDHIANSQPISSPYEAGERYAQFSQNSLSYNDNYNLSYSAQYPDHSRPRSYNGGDLTGLPTSIGTAQSYPPEAYQIEPPKQLDNMDISDQESNGQLIQMSNDYDHNPFNSHIKVEDHTGYQSPYSTMTRASTPHDSMSPYPNSSDPGGEIAIDKEQPYAQLIYQALLHADGHTMILRDIYDWFKKYTDKAAASETKGWQNSIRHNLSMNGAFEKVDQPGEESRKGFMWRLSADAIREGVKSTTRYRSKVPNKRGYRSHHPQPQRQASGSKGGHAARRSVRMRRSNRLHDGGGGGGYTSDPYAGRRAPAAFDSMYVQGMGGLGMVGVGSGGAVDLYSPSSGYASHDDMDFYSKDSSADFASHSTGATHLDLFHPYHGHSHRHGHSPSHDVVRPYSHTSTPHLPHGLPHGMPSGLGLSEQPSYLFEHSSTEGLFADAPSPASVDEPCTPGSADGGRSMWTEDVGLMGWEEGGYREYVG